MTNTQASAADNSEDYINSIAIFGGIQKTIISKDFKGGKVSTIFGETVLDFTYADIKGLAVLEISQAFGKTVVIVPCNWRIETDQTLLLATEEDKRNCDFKNIDADKVLIITGGSLFAVVTIVNL